MKNRSSRTFLLILIAVLSVGFVSCTTDPEKKKKDFVEKGNKYFTAGQFKQASLMYKMALKVDQRYGEAYYRLGLSELKTGRIGDGASALRRAVELQPDNIDANSKLADLYLAAYFADPNRNKSLLSELQDMSAKLLKKDPKSFDGLRVNAYILLANRNFKESIEGFRAANAVKPMQPELIIALSNALGADGQLEEAVRLLHELVAKSKSFAPAYDLLYGIAIRENKLDEAERLLKEKSQNNPTNAQFVMQLAGHYYASRKTAEMKATLQGLTANQKDFPQGFLNAGDFYFRIRELDSAVQAYNDGMKAFPKQRATYQKRLVETYSAQGKPVDALNLVEQLLKMDDKDPEAIAMRASLWLQAGRREQLQTAITDMQSVLSKMPDNFVLRYNLGRALLAKGENDAAKIQFQDSIKIRADYLPPRLALTQVQLQKGEMGAALQTVNEILAIQPSNQAALLLRTSTLLAMKDYPKAKSELDAILKQYPDSRDAKFQTAMVYFSQKDYKKADEIFRGLRALNPPDPRGLMGLTETYMASLQYDAALTLIKEELAKNPDRLDYRIAIGNISARAGKYDQAMNEFRAVLAKTPNSSDILVKLGEVCKLKKDDNCALDYFRKAAAVNDKDPNPQLRLALLYDNLGMRAQARPVYDQILKVQPDNWVALNNIAYILAEEGKDLDQALTLAQRAKQKMPNEPNVADTMGWIYIKKNLSEPAIQIYKDLTTRDGSVSTWHYHLGMALYQRGDKVQAKKSLETAISKNPPKEELGKIRELLAKIG